MKLWFLDNSYTDYVVLAATEDEAWEKLNEVDVFQVDAYGELVEVTNGFQVSSPNDLHFLM